MVNQFIHNEEKAKQVTIKTCNKLKQTKNNFNSCQFTTILISMYKWRECLSFEIISIWTAHKKEKTKQNK